MRDFPGVSLNIHIVVSAPCSNGDVRLVGGSVANEGRVEVCIDNQWGSVCDSMWDSTDTSVVCGQLGFLQSGEGNFFTHEAQLDTSSVHSFCPTLQDPFHSSMACLAPVLDLYFELSHLLWVRG